MLATSKASPLAFWYWKRPVSVMTAHSRFWAIVWVRWPRTCWAYSATMTPAAAASGLTTPASQKRSPEGWWSMTATLRERSSTWRASFRRPGAERSTQKKRSGSVA